MLASATNFSAHPTAPDAGYASWQNAARKVVMRHDPEGRTAAPVPTFGRMVHNNVTAAQSYAPHGTGKETPDIAYETPEDDDHYTFNDVLDIINPLQHLPVIGTLYRKFTGDTIKPMSNIIGGAIFGGPVGAVSSTINVVAKSTTGKDITENAFAMVGVDITPSAKKPVIAYEKAAALGQQKNMANANIVEDISSLSFTGHKTHDGRRNFYARNTATNSWNV